ncbi:hypothetical protein NLJ89_g739 [Agrocybe chaxingu]|uniref:Trafficking protein particle complex II-specific subunit 65 IgD3 domain-containing protein n=1 Tax=Agrocybe chaxingu TaxID=84603 RepID=A0A9W8N1I7_9AGAR|nr:hypothetical protein NLJ89_g739 [Agrocybe chaxingu]
MALSLDQIFSTTVLDVLVPDTSLDFPPRSPTDEWLAKIKSNATERRQAFFDEQLHSILLLHIKNPEESIPEDTSHPPESIRDLLAHVQVSLEAAYISAIPSAVETPKTSRLLLPTPRTGATGRPSGRLNPHPSILPPSTPNPVPATGDLDRKYTTSEGTVLVAQIWGGNTSDDSAEEFALLWSRDERSWIAVYRMVITVSFLRLSFNDPLLCLTVSATLREKPIPTTPKHPLEKFFASIGEASAQEPQPQPQETEDEVALLDGLEEVNLLEGLLAGPTFSKLELNLPTVRLGTQSRQKLFSLPPVLVNTPVLPSPSPMTATASGFRVRMRTVFVPYVLLPETEGTVDDLDEEEKDRERREAGSEERTVVLCVEIENSGDMGANAGFVVEKVDVTIGGEGAKATLIGWGENGFTSEAAKKILPLRVGPLAQYNLLYAVTFMRSPEESDAFSFARPGAQASSDLQRAVTINVFGKPYFPPPLTSKILIPDMESVSYPTQTFSSRWNCVLDLAAQQNQPSDMLDQNDYPNAMPEPPSPFPVFSMYSSNTNTTGTPGMYSGASTPQYSATAGSKTIHPTTRGQLCGTRPSSLMLGPQSSAQYLRSPTTYSAPPPPPVSTMGQPPAPLPILVPENEDALGGPQTGLPTTFETPMTPAYPAFPTKSALPPTPMSQGPIASSTMGNFGPSVEIKRDRGPAADFGGVPQTPLPLVSGAFGEQKMLAKLQGSSNTGENIVVSIGLLPLPYERRGGKEVILGPGKIYPLDVFTLDIFVFNQSLWPRRFEVTCPERRRRRRGGTEMGVYDGGSQGARKMGYPGVLPLESRVRIGPLKPSACQSVRMDFLAVSPGVHSIDSLTLTDIETGFSMNLRSVLDVVVHDPND